MVEKTLAEEKLTRDEVAERLRNLADEFEEEGAATIRTGNKTVDVRPPESIAYELEVREQSSLLRGNRETVTLKMDWKPSDPSEPADESVPSDVSEDRD